MSYHEDGEGSGSFSRQSAEDRKAERVNKVRSAIDQLNGEDLSSEEADQLHGLLLDKVKRMKSGIIFDG